MVTHVNRLLFPSDTFYADKLYLVRSSSSISTPNNTAATHNETKQRSLVLLHCIYLTAYILLITQLRLTYIKQPWRRLNYVIWHLHLILFPPIATVRVDKITYQRTFCYFQHTDANTRPQEMTFRLCNHWILHHWPPQLSLAITDDYGDVVFMDHSWTVTTMMLYKSWLLMTGL